jgi:oligopeptidase A
MGNLLLEKNVLDGNIPFRDITINDYDEALSTLLEKSKIEHEQQMQNPVYTWQMLFDEKYTFQSHLSAVFHSLSHLKSIQDTQEVRDIYNKHLPLIQQFQFEANHIDERPFQIIKHYLTTDDYKNLTPLKKKIVDKMYEDYVLSGALLPLEQKQELQEIDEKLSMLAVKFSQNVVDDKDSREWLIEDKNLLKGVPERIINKAQEQAQLKGKAGYLFDLSEGTADELLVWADNEEIRKMIYVGSSMIANNEKFDNSEITKEILQLKQRQAVILGFKTYAEQSLHDKMVKDPQKVLNFLEDLKEKAYPFAVKEKQKVNDFANQLLGHKAQFWDNAYVVEKLRQEQYSYDDEELRKYFPLNKVLDGLFSKVKELFGLELKINEEQEQRKWHEDVMLYDVFEEGKKIGELQLDLFKRPAKRDGAWMNPTVSRHIYDDGENVQPLAYIVANFAKASKGEVQTISFDDVITMYHEMGHAIHHLITKVEKSYFAGTNVEWDAVELPSQLLENFVYDKNLLNSMTWNHEKNETLPDDLYQKIVDSKNFNAALATLRQVRLAKTDMLSHLQTDVQNIKLAKEIEQEVAKETSIGEYDELRLISNQFGHIFAGGYAAGYYGYKWAEVLSADAYYALEEDPTLISKYKVEILEMGGSRDMLDSFVAFRGREPDVSYLLKQSGLVESTKANKLKH